MYAWCTRACTHTHVGECVGAKCHINRLIAPVSDSVTLWLVDSSLIHTPSWVIGPPPLISRLPAKPGGTLGSYESLPLLIGPRSTPPPPSHNTQAHRHRHTHTKSNCGLLARSTASSYISMALPLLFFRLISPSECATGCRVAVSSPSVNFFFLPEWNIFIDRFLWVGWRHQTQAPQSPPSHSVLPVDTFTRVHICWSFKAQTLCGISSNSFYSVLLKTVLCKFFLASFCLWNH